MRRSFATASTSLRYANGHNEIQEVLACARTENARLHGRRGLEEHLVGRDRHKAVEYILVIQGDLNAFARHIALPASALMSIFTGDESALTKPTRFTAVMSSCVVKHVFVAHDCGII